MTIKETLRGLLGRTGGQVSASAKDKRRTQPLPLYIGSTPARDGLPKPTAVNLRRFAETPIARKAINTVKDRTAGMKWRVQARRDRQADAPRIAALTSVFEAPNPDDSFRSFAEQV